MEITDRELLAICNLSNLRMEFALIKKDEEKKEDKSENEIIKTEKILSNHTIYSDFKN